MRNLSLQYNDYSKQKYCDNPVGSATYCIALRIFFYHLPTEPNLKRPELLIRLLAREMHFAQVILSHLNSLYCRLNFSPPPQHICTHLLSCCRATRPTELRPASFSRKIELSQRHHLTSGLIN